MSTTLFNKWSAVALAGLASFLLAACGGSSSANDAASRQAANEQRLVKFAQCLREHGVNATPQGGGSLSVTGGSAGSPMNKQAMQAAMNACSRYRPTDEGAAKLSPAERAARVDQVYKFARCMREHGIEVTTETRGGGGAVGVQLKGTGPGNPRFEAAQKACESFMPKPPGGRLRTGGPGPGGGPGGSGGATLQVTPGG
jgi:hypothetical protein